MSPPRECRACRAVVKSLISSLLDRAFHRVLPNLFLLRRETALPCLARRSSPRSVICSSARFPLSNTRALQKTISLKSSSSTRRVRIALNPGCRAQSRLCRTRWITRGPIERNTLCPRLGGSFACPCRQSRAPRLRPRAKVLRHRPQFLTCLEAAAIVRRRCLPYPQRHNLRFHQAPSPRLLASPPLPAHWVHHHS